ncbi:MAG: hypothetical protein ABI977_09390 [Acidobacteriota bacterium]
MPTRKNIEDTSELAMPQNVNSAQEPDYGDRSVRVVCTNWPEETIYVGLKLHLQAVLDQATGNPKNYDFDWETEDGSFEINDKLQGKKVYSARDTICLATNGITDDDTKVTVTVKTKDGESIIGRGFKIFKNREPKNSDIKHNIDQKIDQMASEVRGVASRLQEGVNVSLQRSAVEPTSDLALWVVIRESARAMSFANYQRFTDMVLCGKDDQGQTFPTNDINNPVYGELRNRRFLPFNDTDAYRLLKTATEAFLLVNGGVALESLNFSGFDLDSPDGIQLSQTQVRDYWDRYLRDINGNPIPTVPYLWLIRNKLNGQPLKNQIFLHEDPRLAGTADNRPERCEGVLLSKLSQPFLIELIWSYWQEEGMLVQTMNAISRRFQNVRNPRGERDPLATLEMDPLRPLNNLMWGHIQDEQHRLSIVRRAYEYDHHYGISIEGRAVPNLRPADSRSKFLEAFHQLLHLCIPFFKQDDDTTVRADGFPILNALKEVHLILSQGAHNQFGDLPSTARQEMLMQQWLLARPEFREFLPTRVMVAYPEPWMDRVDAMKSLQGWTDTSVMHFHNLAVYGEQLLLSIRYGAWNQPSVSSAQASNWARFWRSQIQSYIHAYRAVTGVELGAASHTAKVDSTPPSVHLRNRMARRA